MAMLTLVYINSIVYKMWELPPQIYSEAYTVIDLI